MKTLAFSHRGSFAGGRPGMDKADSPMVQVLQRTIERTGQEIYHLLRDQLSARLDGIEGRLADLAMRLKALEHGKRQPRSGQGVAERRTNGRMRDPVGVSEWGAAEWADYLGLTEAELGDLVRYLDRRRVG
jgi:hypothetical protein